MSSTASSTVSTLSQLSSAPRTPSPGPSLSGAVNPTLAGAVRITGIQSSPVKTVDVFADHYKDIEASSVVLDKKIDPNFLRSHLSSPPPNVNWEDNTQDQPLIDVIAGANTHSDIIYTPLTALLNRYSDRIHASLLVAERPQHPLVFLDHHHHAPIAHPDKNQEKPDLVAVPGPITDYTQVENGTHYSNVPYHKVFSIVECKPTCEDGAKQAARYCFRLMLARPDMPGVYALWARPQGYQVIWSDASGVVASPETPWANLELLGAYVYSLYCQPPTHFLRDPYVHSPKLLSRNTSKGPHWTITCPNDTYYYSDCETLSIGDPWNRRTHVWKHTDEQGIVVIKDSYRDNERRFKEEVLLDKIHGEEEIYPGVVRKLHGGGIPDITTAKPATGASKRTPERTKTRLVMGSFGEVLNQAKSVRDILMVVYDVLEIHRGLYKDRRVLHRDISSYNILIKPKHHRDTRQGKALAKDRPTFIREVLSPELKGKDADLSMALLIDFDNAADLDEKSESVTQDLAARTGTPMFIARSVASGRLLTSDAATDYPTMPVLKKQARELYIQAYDKPAYEDFCDGPDQLHGCARPKVRADSDNEDETDSDEEDETDSDDKDETDIGQESNKPVQFSHRADHDVESIYWVLVVTLLRVQPKGVSAQGDPSAFYDLWESFSQHVIMKGKKSDSRDKVFNQSVEDWRDALNPKLRSLSRMLYDMGKHIRPEYGLLRPLKEDHLHEAMRRLLLKQIVKMESKPILLQRGKLRYVPTPPPLPSLKRRTESLASESKSKKSKTSLADDGRRPRRMVAVDPK